MLTVKLLRYGVPTFSGGTDCPTTRDPLYTESIDVRPAKRIFVEMRDKHSRRVLSVIDPAGGLEQFTIGDVDRTDVMYHCVYVMNEAGRTIETIS